jgi:hypothetical protein
MTQIATVKYQMASYEGEEIVCGVDENDDNDHIIARAKGQMRRRDTMPSMPMYYESWKVVDRREE